MRLNPDLIRDILFFVEEHTGYNKPVSIARNISELDFPLNKAYSPEEILYHIELCKEYGYIKTTWTGVEYILINRLSVSGHELLENIRQENNWNQTKTIAKQAGSISLDVISNIASNIISSIIIKHLGL